MERSSTATRRTCPPGPTPWRSTDTRSAAERIRPLIGKGGDKVLRELLGLEDDAPLARRIDDDRRRLFLDHLLPGLKPTRGARDLLLRMKGEGLGCTVATSASGAELQALLRQAGIEDLIEHDASASDAEHSKPHPDIVQVALEKSGAAPRSALLLGDTPYDVEAARAAGVDTIALRCGGFWDDAALAGAIAIYDDPAALLADWDRSPLAGRAAATTR